MPSQFVFHPIAVETRGPLNELAVKRYWQTHCLVLWWRLREFFFVSSFSCRL